MDMDRFKKMTFGEVYGVLEKSDGLDEKLEVSEKALEGMQAKFKNAERETYDVLEKADDLAEKLKVSEGYRKKAEEHLVKANNEISSLHDVLDEKRLEIHKAQVILKKIKEVMGGHTGEKADEVEKKGEAEEDTPSSHQE